MYGNKRLMYKRISAAVMCIMMLMLVLFFSAVIVVEAGHECSGEDCPVCSVVSACEDMIRSFGLAKIMQVMIISAVLCLFSAGALYIFQYFHETPVTEKIRMNN